MDAIESSTTYWATVTTAQITDRPKPPKILKSIKIANGLHQRWLNRLQYQSGDFAPRTLRSPFIQAFDDDRNNTFVSCEFDYKYWYLRELLDK